MYFSRSLSLSKCPRGRSGCEGTPVGAPFDRLRDRYPSVTNRVERSARDMQNARIRKGAGVLRGGSTPWGPGERCGASGSDGGERCCRRGAPDRGRRGCLLRARCGRRCRSRRRRASASGRGCSAGTRAGCWSAACGRLRVRRAHHRDRRWSANPRVRRRSANRRVRLRSANPRAAERARRPWRASAGPCVPSAIPRSVNRCGLEE